MWWLLAGLALLAGSAPAAILWLLSDAPQQQPVALDQLLAADGAFLLAACCVLWIGERQLLSGRTTKPPPCLSWIDGPPRGFPAYMLTVAVAGLAAPAAALAAALCSSSPETRSLASTTLAPYLLLLVPQVALELLMAGRWSAPAVSLLFSPFRLCQEMRSLRMLRAAGSQTGLLALHGALLTLWVGNAALTLLWLPELYGWGLQDARKLARACTARDAVVAAQAAERRRRLTGWFRIS